MTANDLAQALTTASQAITEQGELPLPVRDGLKSALRRLCASDEVFFRLWGRLQLGCAQYSHWVWRRQFPNDPDPVQFAENCLQQRCAQESALVELAHLRKSLDDKLLLGPDVFPAVYAGFAGWAAARDMLGGPRATGLAQSELDVDPQDWDACFQASIAVAGAATWEDGGGDREQRRQFWRWYLTEAIPNAVENHIG